MSELETSLHLFQPTRYRASDDTWHDELDRTLDHVPDQLTLDPACILSAFATGWPCDDRTFVQEITRQPWLSAIDNGKIQLEQIPSHGRLWMSPQEIASRLKQALLQEAERVCQGRRELYVLLSGGLDSRIVAGVLAILAREGKLECTPIAVSWGREDSRDVVYGRHLANLLGFQWQHIPIGPDSVLTNLEPAGKDLGGVIAPHHLHGMTWFENASPDALVLGGSYGDSVGRAEYSGLHALELKLMQPTNCGDLLRPEVVPFASAGLQADLQRLKDRNPGQPGYVYGEYEGEANYMRGMLAHGMGIINRYCHMYQMFTDPRVYGLMWSLHPSARTNEPYAELLELLGSDLARMPWARTNRALRGPTRGADPNAVPRFHEYLAWIRGPLWEELEAYVDPEWFGDTKLFDAGAIQAVKTKLKAGGPSVTLGGGGVLELFMRLVGFRCYTNELERRGKTLVAPDIDTTALPDQDTAVDASRMSFIGNRLRRSKTLVNWTRTIRRYRLRRWAIKAFPPIVDASDSTTT